MIFCTFSIRSFYPCLKKESKRKTQNRTKLVKKEILLFLLVLADQSAIRTTRAPCLASQAFSFCISAVHTPAGRAACQCAPPFRYFPRPRCCGLIAPFPEPCVSSGGRLPEALFMVFYRIPKVQKHVHLLDLVKRFLTSIYLHNLASIRPRTSL